MRKQRVMMTPERLAEIRKLRAEGVGVAEIVRRVGISRGSVVNYAPLEPRGYQHEEEILARLREGVPAGQICRELDVQPWLVSSVANRARAAGTLPPREAPAARPSRRSPAAKVTTIRLGSAPAPSQEETDHAVIDVAQEITTASLRERILRAICEHGPYEDANGIIKDIRRPTGDGGWDLHEVHHLIQTGLARQGLVTYREDKNGRFQQLRAIKATEAGFRRVGLGMQYRQVGSRVGSHTPLRQGDTTDFRGYATRAQGGEIVRESEAEHLALYPEHHHQPLAGEQPAAVVEATSEDEPVASYLARLARYPLLMTLRRRQSEKDAARAKAARFLEAAAILADVDREQSEQLLARAGDIEGEPFSPLEAEYLAYAASAATPFTPSSLGGTMGSTIGAD